MDGGNFGMHRFGSAPSGGRSGWRWFPWAVAGAMGIVIVANAGLVVTAMRSFPGAAEGNGFALSNAYNHVLQDEARQEALGWTVLVALDAAQRPAVTLTDRNGRALEDAVIEATAARPLGPPQTTPLAMHAAGGGRYLSDMALPRGQWDVTLSAKHGDDLVRAVRRLVVR